jgi:hypothetical protein
MEDHIVLDAALGPNDDGVVRTVSSEDGAEPEACPCSDPHIPDQDCGWSEKDLLTDLRNLPIVREEESHLSLRR